jgi:hypothetical protein
MSRLNAPVGIAGTSSASWDPSRMIEPLPNCFVIWYIASENVDYRQNILTNKRICCISQRLNGQPILTITMAL